MEGGGAPWQLGFEKVEQRCGYLLTSGQWSDCTFVVGSETNQEVIQAHKLVLAIASPVFEAMFYGGLSEPNEPMIPIPDVQPEAFRALLQYIYTGEINIGSFDMACDLWYGAKKYMLLHLVKECNGYICSVVGPRNACRAYELACFFEEQTLMDKCIQIICTNTNEVLNDRSFEDVELNTLTTVLSLNHLNVDSELDLFHAVARYAEAEQRTQGEISPPVDGKPPSEKLFKSLGPSISEEMVLQSVESSSQTSLAAELDLKRSSEVVTSKPTTDKENFKEVETLGSWSVDAKCLVGELGRKLNEVKRDSRSGSFLVQRIAIAIQRDEPTIRAAIEKIRFLSLTPQQFAEGPARSGLLTEAESFAVIMNIISRVSAVPMPTGFSECRERRQPRSDSVEEGPFAEPRSKPSTESFCVAATKLPTPADIVRGLLSRERKTLEHAARSARHMTCADADGTSENLTQLVAAGGIPPLVAALRHPRPGVQYDAAWALTNIACDREHAMTLVNADAVPVLVGLLGRGGAVAEQAAWTLGNIAGGGDTASNAVMDAGAVPALLAHMQPSTPSTPLATYLRTYRILCQKHISSFWLRSRFQLVSPAVPYIENLLVLADEQVLAEACWVLYHLADGAHFDPQLFTPSLAARLAALLRPAAARVQAAALGAVGSMLGTTELIDRYLGAGCLDHIMNFLKCGNPSLVEYAARAAGNILRTPLHIQLALDKGILDALGPALTEGDDECKSNAGCAITNLCIFGAASQLRVLAEAAALQPFCRLLAAGRRTSYCILIGLANLLKKVEHNKLALLQKLRDIGVPQLLITVQREGGQHRELANDLLRIYYRDDFHAQGRSSSSSSAYN